jgi:hypothetical protein
MLHAWIVLMCWMWPGTLLAQVPLPTQPPMVLVTVRDVHGVGIADLTVLVWDQQGHTLFARSRTDAAGVAPIATLPSSDLRIQVQGVLPNGQPLVMQGHDQLGIAIQLVPPTTTLDLLVEPSGVVLPDPTRMLALEVGGPLVSPLLPTAQLAAWPASATPPLSSTMSTMSTMAPTPSPAPSALPTSVASAPAAPTVDGWAVLLVLFLLVLVIVVLIRLADWQRAEG